MVMAGFVIGSEMSEGVKNVYVSECSLSVRMSGCGLKVPVDVVASWRIFTSSI